MELCLYSLYVFMVCIPLHYSWKSVLNNREWIRLRNIYVHKRIKRNVNVDAAHPGLNAGGCSKKGKAVPLQAWTGPEGSRKLRFPDFMTTAQDGGKVVSLTHRPPLPPGNIPGTHFC